MVFGFLVLGLSMNRMAELKNLAAAGIVFMLG